MKTKKVLLIVLVAIVCLFTNSCENKTSLELYKAYVCNSSNSSDLDYGDVVYNEPTNTYSLPKKVTSVKTGMQNKQLELGSDLIALEYNNTYNKDYCEYLVNSYSNSTYNIRANYREDDGTLDYLQLGNYKYRISDQNITSQEHLLQVCRNYLLTHVENLESYTISIETRITTTDENGVDNDTISGFAVATKDNQVAVYKVNYTFYIDEIKTSEIINISLSSEGYLKTVSINMVGTFSKLSNYDIDIDLCNQIISSEVNSLCNIDNYQLEGYTDSKILIMTNNRLCVLSFVHPNFTEDNETEGFVAEPIQLLIPINILS